MCVLLNQSLIIGHLGYFQFFNFIKNVIVTVFQASHFDSCVCLISSE